MTVMELYNKLGEEIAQGHGNLKVIAGLQFAEKALSTSITLNVSQNYMICICAILMMCNIKVVILN